MVFGFGRKRSVESHWRLSPEALAGKPIATGLVTFAQRQAEGLDKWIAENRARVSTEEPKTEAEAILSALHIVCGHLFAVMMRAQKAEVGRLHGEAIEGFYADPSYRDIPTPACALTIVDIMAAELSGALVNEGVIEREQLAAKWRETTALTLRNGMLLHDADHLKSIRTLTFGLSDALAKAHEEQSKFLVKSIGDMAFAYVVNETQPAAKKKTEAEFEGVFLGLFNMLRPAIESR